MYIQMHLLFHGLTGLEMLRNFTNGVSLSPLGTVLDFFSLWTKGLLPKHQTEEVTYKGFTHGCILGKKIHFEE